VVDDTAVDVDENFDEDESDRALKGRQQTNWLKWTWSRFAAVDIDEDEGDDDSDEASRSRQL
jgi:hypothetical protein